MFDQKSKVGEAFLNFCLVKIAARGLPNSKPQFEDLFYPAPSSHSAVYRFESKNITYDTVYTRFIYYSPENFPFKVSG